MRDVTLQQQPAYLAMTANRPKQEVLYHPQPAGLAQAGHQRTGALNHKNHIACYMLTVTTCNTGQSRGRGHSHIILTLWRTELLTYTAKASAVFVGIVTRGKSMGSHLYFSMKLCNRI